MRFGGAVPKPLLALHGRPLVAYALDAALASGADPVVLVVSDDRVAAAAPAGVLVVRNEDPERGIASSLHAALHALAPDARVGAVAVGLGDQPLVGPEAYRRLAAAFDAGIGLAVATYGGARGNPVLVGREHWPAALAITGDEGARALFGRVGVHEVPCDGTGSPTDVDTPADLARLEQRWRSPTASE